MCSYVVWSLCRALSHLNAFLLPHCYYLLLEPAVFTGCRRLSVKLVEVPFHSLLRICLLVAKISFDLPGFSITKMSAVLGTWQPKVQQLFVVVSLALMVLKLPAGFSASSAGLTCSSSWASVRSHGLWQTGCQSCDSSSNNVQDCLVDWVDWRNGHINSPLTGSFCTCRTAVFGRGGLCPVV